MNTTNAVHVHDKDSCVTVTVPVGVGTSVTYHCSSGEVESVLSTAEIPIYHKIAITQVQQGDFVYKYGEKIGIATQDIAPGDHVHVHNIKPVGFVEEAVQ